MKFRLIMIIAAALAAASCLKSGTYEARYQSVVTFDQFSKDWDNSSEWEGTFYGDDKAYFKTPFTVDALTFNCSYKEYGETYSGFGLSMATEEDTDFGGTYSVNAAKAYSGDVFALFHNHPSIKLNGDDPAQHIIFKQSEYGTCTPVGCMVNNTRLVADEIRKYNDSHDEVIEVMLKITGFNGNAETGSVDFMLAGPSDKAEARDSIVSTWTAVDLKDLGDVDFINFSISFSDSDQKTIPEYFCLDNFVADIYVYMAGE